MYRKVFKLYSQTELLEIDTKKSPLEKLQCIVKCCNSIFGIFVCSCVQYLCIHINDYRPACF